MSYLHALSGPRTTPRNRDQIGVVLGPVGPVQDHPGWHREIFASSQVRTLQVVPGPLRPMILAGWLGEVVPAAIYSGDHRTTPAAARAAQPTPPEETP